jgi:putative transposase
LVDCTFKKQKPAYPLPVELIDQLVAQVENKDAESILGESGLATQLKKMLAKRMPSAELNHQSGQRGRHQQKSLRWFAEDCGRIHPRERGNTSGRPDRRRATTVHPRERGEHGSWIV